MFLTEFIGFPIGLYVEKFKEKEVPDSKEDVTQGGQARHDGHLFLEGGPVRVLGGTTLDGSGEETLRIHRLSHRVARGKNRRRKK